MDIMTFSEELKERIKTVNNAMIPEDDLTAKGRVLKGIREIIDELKVFTIQYRFTSNTEEILFFKEVKPVLLSQYFYHKKMLDICIHSAYRNRKGRKKLYQSVLSEMEQYAQQHDEFLSYCLMGQTYDDERYFLRKEHALSVTRDDRFSTGYDNKLAKMVAHELIRKNVLELIGKLSGSVHHATTVQWTGNKTDAVELIVALQASGHLDQGTAETKQMIKIFENCFNLKLDNYYDLLKKIRMRKGNRTSFLDGLKQKLLYKLDEMDL